MPGLGREQKEKSVKKTKGSVGDFQRQCGNVMGRMKFTRKTPAPSIM